MGLMISSIAKIRNESLPKNMFKSNSDYYLYILEYGDFNFLETHNYSSEPHISGMSKILNNYIYDCNNINFQKLESKTFHSDNDVISYRKIFDIENLNDQETKPAKITPAFLVTTIEPNKLNKLNSDTINNNEFIFLKFTSQKRDPNIIPQLVNEIFSQTGIAISKCTQSSVRSKYENVHLFDYNLEMTKPTINSNNYIINNNGPITNIDNSNNNGSINNGPITNIDNSNNNGSINNTNTSSEIGNRSQNIEPKCNDEFAKKSFIWTKWGGISDIISTIIGWIIR